jgi:hypothetical protein
MPPAGFEPTISAGERPQTHALDCAVTGTDTEGLLSKNVKIKIHISIILPVVLCGCETWSLTLRKESRLRVFENRAMRRIFGSKREEIRGAGEDCIMRSFMFCTYHQILFG